MLNNIANNIAQYGQRDIVECCCIQQPEQVVHSFLRIPFTMCSSMNCNLPWLVGVLAGTQDVEGYCRGSLLHSRQNLFVPTNESCWYDLQA